MEQSHIDSPSDLIYLFLDGEASGAQQAVLFQRLAKDDELQAEFAEALKIRAATELERSETHPPASLTAGLFRSAGFAPPTAPLPVPPSSLFGSSLGSLPGLALAALAGALVTALILFGVQDRRIGRLEERLARTATVSGAGNGAPALSHGNERTADERTTTDATGYRSNAEGISGQGMAEMERPTGSSSTRAHSRLHGTAGDGGEMASTMSRRGGSGREIGRRTATSDAAISIVEQPADTIPATVPTTVPATVPAPTAPAHDPRNDIPTQALDDAGLASALDALRGESSSPISSAETIVETAAVGSDGGRFALALRSTSDLAYWPRQTAPERGPWFNNMSLSLLYRIADGFRIGIEGGQENFPHYDLSDGAEIYQPRILWGGAALEYAPAVPFPIDALRPSLHVLIGATPLGPAGKGSLGVAFTPERSITLTAGAELTAFLYSRQGMLFSARKGGLAVGMAFNF